MRRSHARQPQWPRRDPDAGGPFGLRTGTNVRVCYSGSLPDGLTCTVVLSAGPTLGLMV